MTSEFSIDCKTLFIKLYYKRQTVGHLDEVWLLDTATWRPDMEYAQFEFTFIRKTKDGVALLDIFLPTLTARQRLGEKKWATVVFFLMSVCASMGKVLPTQYLDFILFGIDTSKWVLDTIDLPMHFLDDAPSFGGVKPYQLFPSLDDDHTITYSRTQLPAFSPDEDLKTK